MMEVFPNHISFQILEDRPVGINSGVLKLDRQLKLHFELPAHQVVEALNSSDGQFVYFEMDIPNGFGIQVKNDSPELKTSVDYLNQAIKEQGSRAVTYDSPEGERSMGKTIEMFNILYDKDLTEVQGWQFMVILKMVRASQGNFKSDNYVDQASYSSLAGEADGTANKN